MADNKDPLGILGDSEKKSDPLGILGNQPVKKKEESVSGVPSEYPMGRGPLALPTQETPTWKEQIAVGTKEVEPSGPAKPVAAVKPVVPKGGYEPTMQEQLKKIEAMTFQVKYPEYEKPKEFDFATESAKAVTEEERRRVEENKQRAEQKRLQSLPREIEKLKAERNELVLDKSPDAKSRIAALDAVAKKYERELKKAQQPQYATLANINQKAVKGLEEEANAYLDGVEAQNSLNALIEEANRLYYDDSPESQQRLAENERQRVKLEAEILKSGKLKSKLDRVGLNELETYELLQSAVAQKILPLEADIQTYAKEGTVELAKQKADLAKKLSGLQDKALPIAEKIKTLQNEYLNKNGYAELNKQIAEAEQKIKSYEPFVKGAQAKQKLYQQDIDNLESQLQSYASLIEGDKFNGTQQQLDNYKEIAKEYSIAVANFNNAWKITELAGYEDAANLYNSLTEKRKSLTQGLLSNADYAKATSELEGIMGQIKTSAEEYKQYDAPEIRNRINGFLNTANKINEYDEKLKAARGKLTSVEEVKKAQDAYNASGIGGDWADIGGRAVNSIVGTLNKLVASPFRIAASLSDVVDNKYGFSDYVADLIEGEPFMVKETNVLYDPVTDKINWGVMPVLKSLADQVGIIAVLGVSGRVATPAYSRLLSKQSADLFRQSAIVDEAVAATTIAPAFIISYGEQYKAALEKGFTPEQASAYGSAMSLIEGLSELILPDQKLLFGKETSDVLMSRFVKNYAKGKKQAIKQLVLDFAENAGSETVEEQMPMIGEMLGTFIGNYVNEDIKIEIPTINQQINTDLVAALSGGLMGLSGKIGDDRRLYRKSVADLAVDFTRSKELLDAFKKKGLIDPNRYDKLVSDVQKYQSIRGKVPQGLGRFQTIGVADKMLEIYDLASKIDDQDKNNPMNEIYRKKMKQLQGDIESIIDDKEYESKAEAEYNKELQEYVRSTEEVIENIRQTAVPVEQVGNVVLQKYTSGTSKIYGYIDRGDGKGKIELTEEEFLSEQKGLTNLIREQRDLEIQELEKIRPDLTDQDLLLTDLPASVDKTLDRVYEGTPTDPVQIQEAIDALDKKFDELEAYKKDPKRTHTTEVIDSLIDVLSEAKSTLQRYENEVRPTEVGTEEGAGKPEVPSAKGVTPEQKAAGGEVTTPSVPAIEAAEDISKEDENYRQSREVTEAVSKENPDASVLITPRGNDLNLAAVYVGKEKRGKGIGSKVLDSVKRQADRLGKKVVLDATNELDEETDLEKLGKFYERNGFVKVGENKYEYNPPKGGGIAAPSVPAERTKEEIAAEIERLKKEKQDELDAKGLNRLFPIEIDETTLEGKKLAQEKIEQQKKKKEINAKYDTQITELQKQYDKENIQGVSGEERVGQEPEQAKPEQKGGAEAPSAGGILQATEEEIAATAKRGKLKAGDYSDMSPIQVMAELRKLPELKQLADEAISLQEEIDRMAKIAGGRVEGMPTLFPYRLVVDFITSAKKTKEKQDSAVDKFKGQIEELKQYLKTKPSDAELGKMKQDREVRAKEEAEKIKANQELSAQKVAAINQIEKKESSFIESINKNDSRTIANLLYSGLTKNTIIKLNQVRLALEQINGINMPLFKVEKIMAKYEYDTNKFIEELKNKQFDIFSSAKANDLIEILSTKEELLKPTTDETKTETKDGEPLPKGVSGVRPEGEGREKGPELRPEAEEEVTKEFVTNAGRKGEKPKTGVGSGEVNPTFSEKKVLVGDKTSIRFADGTKEDAEFMVVELDDIMASHDEESFSDTKGFPTMPDGRNVNSRNYKGDRAAQGTVTSNAMNLDPDILITDNVTTDQGAPIITEDGIVISANGRTMSLKLAEKKYPEKYKEYRDTLIAKAKRYGIDPKAVAQMKKPVLVKINRNVKEYSVDSFDRYNPEFQKAEAPIDRLLKQSYIIRNNPAVRQRLMELLSPYDTMAELYASEEGKKGLLNFLVANKFILPQSMAEYADDKSNFTEAGKRLAEDIIVGAILRPETIKASQDVKAFRNNVINSIAALATNYTLGNFSLEDEINEAILLQQKVAAWGPQKDFWKYLKQKKLFDAINPDHIIMNRLIESGSKNFRQFIEKYNTGAEGQGAKVELLTFDDVQASSKQEVLDYMTKLKLSQNELEILALVYDRYAEFAEQNKRGIEELGRRLGEEEAPPAEPKEPAEPQKPAGAEVKPSAPAQAPTSVPADLASAISQTSELYSRIYDPETTAKEKRELKSQIKEMLKDYPYLEYIYNNIKGINSQLETAGLLTKEGNCP